MCINFCDFIFIFCDLYLDICVRMLYNNIIMKFLFTLMQNHILNFSILMQTVIKPNRRKEE